MVFDSWAEVVSFLTHVQGRGTPPLHSDWPKVSRKARQSELYEYSWGGDRLASVGLAWDARQRCTGIRQCDLWMACSLEWGNPCFATHTYSDSEVWPCQVKSALSPL